jgi:outer membrane lipoprotein-sorting protein
MSKEMPESMMNIKGVIGVAALLAAFAPAPAASAQNMTLQQVYAQMDLSAAKFQSVQADISVDRYVAIVQQHSTQTGTTAFLRTGGSIEMSMHLNAGSDDPETDLLYKNGELDVFQPAQKQETILSAGANRGEYDSMLTTGFGASSKDLAANWDVTFQGMETIDGVPTAKLDLVSKQQNIRNNFSHITIWVDLARDLSLKQIMYQPDGDARTATYTNIRYNKPVPEKLFVLHIPGGTQITHR